MSIGRAEEPCGRNVFDFRVLMSVMYTLRTGCGEESQGFAPFLDFA